MIPLWILLSGVGAIARKSRGWKGLKSVAAFARLLSREWGFQTMSGQPGWAGDHAKGHFAQGFLSDPLFLGVFQRPPEKHRNTDESHIVIHIGGEGILLQQKYRQRSGRCIALLFQKCRRHGRFDSLDFPKSSGLTPEYCGKKAPRAMRAMRGKALETVPFQPYFGCTKSFLKVLSN